MVNNQLILVSDKPVNNDQLGAHQYLAESLLQIVESQSDNPLVVGLFGSWGTGKSSIIRMYSRQIQNNNSIDNVYIDAWAYSNAKDRFGAGLLREMTEKLVKCKFHRDRIINKIDRRSETWRTSIDLDNHTIVLFVLVLGLFILAIWWALDNFGNLANDRIDLFIILISTVLVNGILNWLLPKIMVTYESRETDVSFNQVEHFRDCYKDILHNANKKTISIVVDNLDRVDPTDALEMIRMLKTFIVEYSDFNLQNKRVVFVIPCDKYELAKHITESLGKTQDSYEFLRKFFSVTMKVPELVHQNIYGFTKNQFQFVLDRLNGITQSDAEDIVFIISQASRRSPRQVKTLINDFISFWNTLTTAGALEQKGLVTPQGAAFFVVIQYFSPDEIIPAIKDEKVLIENLEGSKQHVTHFVNSTSHYRKAITEREWIFLSRYQLSEDEKIFPNFWALYDAVLARDSKAIMNLTGEVSNVRDVVHALNRKIMEEGAFSKVCLSWWVLTCLEESKLMAHDIPKKVIDDVNSAILRSWVDFEVLIREGLALLLTKEAFSSDTMISLFDKCELTDENSRQEIIDKGANLPNFLTSFMEITDISYWEKYSDNVFLSFERAIHEWISEKNERFLSTLMKNFYLIRSEITGERFAEELVNNYQSTAFDENDLANIYSHAEGDGSLAFASQWLDTRPDAPGNYTKETVVLSLSSIKFFYELREEGVSKWVPSDQKIDQLANRVEEFSKGAVNNDETQDAILGAITNSIISLWMSKLGRSANSSHAQNSARDQIWPNIQNKLANLNNEERDLILTYLEEFPEIIDSIGHDQLSALSNNPELKILSRLAKKTDKNFLRTVLEVTLGKKLWEDICYSWFSDISKKPAKDHSGAEELQIIFDVHWSRRSSVGEYQQTINGLRPVKRRNAIKQAAQDHMSFWIENTDWSNIDEFEKTISVIRELEDIEEIKSDNVTLLRGGVKRDDAANQISVLSDDNREWAKIHLLNLIE